MRQLLFLVGVSLVSSLHAQDISRERFEKPLKALEQMDGQYEESSALLQAMLKQGARNQAFFLQTLFKLYEDYQKHAKSMVKLSKSYEDLLGSITDVQDWKEFLEKMPSRPKGISEYLNAELEKRTEEAAVTLKELRDDKALKEIRSTLDGWDFGSYRKDREAILSQMQDHLKKVENEDYDLNQLEGQNGIHEFRRDIRLFLIQSQGLNGLIGLNPDRCPRAQFIPLTKDPIAKKPWNILPQNPNEKPCRISQCLYLALSKLSDDLSQAKDVGQGEEMLARFYKAQNWSEEDALFQANIMARAHRDYHDYRARAKKLRQELVHSELLYLVRQEIKECRD